MAEIENNSQAKETDALFNGERKSNGQPKNLQDYDIEDRLGFIRKVYGILTMQLMFTFGCIAAVKLDEDTNEFMKRQSATAITLMFLSFIP